MRVRDMVSKIKLFLFLGIVLGGGWLGQNIYSYFFSKGLPSLSVVGLEPEGSYKGDTACCVKGRDDYRVTTLSIAIDGKPLVGDFKIRKKEFEYSLTIPMQTLSNGKHTIIVEIENGTYLKGKASQEIPFYVDNTPLQAAFVKNEVDLKVPQGRTLHLYLQANKEIKSACAHVFYKSYPYCSQAERSVIYECFVPLDCEQAPGEYLVTTEVEDKVGNKITLESKFQVTAFPFKRQALKINEDKIKEENETGLPERKLEEEIETLSNQSPCKKLWHGTFCTPIHVRTPQQITTDFGVIRTSPHRGLRQHKAIDLYDTPKSVVWASQDGIVVLKNRYAHSGNTVVIDHGCGVLSLYFHLDSFAAIEVGQKIKKGEPIGTIGKTGYATGYHIHWELRLHNVPVDPMQWTKPNF
jgi:murein DD-endopeptidase MepM/ murein hydrolase activator NlpD